MATATEGVPDCAGYEQDREPDEGVEERVEGEVGPEGEEGEDAPKGPSVGVARPDSAVAFEHNAEAILVGEPACSSVLGHEGDEGPARRLNFTRVKRP